jgi:outer membrane immunogenic protein
MFSHHAITFKGLDMNIGKMRLAGTATAACLLFSTVTTPGSAGDLLPAHKGPAPAPVFTWTGFYVGLNAGYAFGTADTTITSLVPAFSSDYDGFLGGAQIGYNWQSGALVFGVEADLQFADVSGTEAVPGFANTSTNTLQWFGTVRGRIGYTFGRVLPYVTGGFAFGKNELELASTAGNSVDDTATQTGWTIGGGIEFAVRDAWSVKIEYLHVDLRDKSYLTNVILPGISLTSGLEFDLVRAGVNYRF